MFLQSAFHRRATAWLAIGLGCIGACVAPAFAQTTPPSPTDPAKAYSTVGIALGETLRLDVVNVGGTNGFPPDPCNVQMGFVNGAGLSVKTANATIAAGQAAFLTLTFAEGAASSDAIDSRTRLNFRPVVSTVVLSTVPPGPCRTVSSAEVFDAVLGRTHVYAVPAESTNPSLEPPPDPDFSIVGITALDTLRFNVTNITGSNGVPPDPCNVQMGFVNEAGQTVKTVAGTIAPGHTAFLTASYKDAAAVAPPAAALGRLNLRPLVSIPPGPCRIAASAELADTLSSLTIAYLIPAVQPNIAPPTAVSTVAQ